MGLRRMTVLLIALAAVTVGCSGKSNHSNGGPPPPPPPASYALAVISLDVVNKDTGEQLTVGGLPAEGGELNVQ